MSNIPTKLNLGCGNDYRESWHNVDANPDVDPDLVQDLEAEDWDLPSDHFSHVLVDNVFEHIEPRHRWTFLKECHRVLQPGGTMEMILPTPGFGTGRDVSHYLIPTWNWHEHPHCDDSWDLVEYRPIRVGPGRILPTPVLLELMFYGIRTMAGIEIEVRATDTPMRGGWK